MTPVVEALVILPLVAKSDVIVPTVVDEVLRTVLPDTVRDVAEALARVALPATVRPPVVEALVKRPLVAKRVPERVVLVPEAFVKYVCPATVRPPVVDALVKRPLVAKRIPVVVLLVIVDEVAKIFCAKRLRKRSVEDPRDPERSADGVMLPATCSLSVGAATPTPMFPF